MTNTKNNDANNAISRERGGNRVGATPSNTAPSKCMEVSFLPLRNGVDSLYLSFRGDLLPEADQRLAVLKREAQSESREHLAQIQINDQIFLVRDKGRPRFKYILESACFEIQLNGDGGLAPVAYVKIASHYLAAKTLQQAYNELYGILNNLCYLEDEGTVSRADLFMDICIAEGFFEKFTEQELIRMADKACTYTGKNNVVTGYTFGAGGHTSCRIYNKTLQIKEVGGQDYLPLLWSKGGREEGETVWRIEFQLRREMLAGFDIRNIHHLQEHLESLWTYLTTKWLRVALPDSNDKTRSRWKTHPLWLLVTEAFKAEGEQNFLKRVQKDSAPDEANVIRNFSSSLISWMALRNFMDVREGLKAFLHELPTMLHQHQTLKGMRLHKHIELELPKRIRKFNLRRNDDDLYSISNFNGLGGK